MHVHNLDESVLTPSPLKQAVLRPALRRMCLTMADQIVANSEHVARHLPGRPAARPAPPPGAALSRVDPARFAAARADRGGFRRALGLAEDAPILLFAGRMTPEKNPVFAVDVLAALRRRMPQAVGRLRRLGQPGGRRAGPRGRARPGATRSGLIGWRDDVAEVMSAGDWFILPHPHHPAEGFGIAVVEAQLAGLRLLLSLGVSDAPILPGAAWRRLSLDDGADAWAEAAVQLWTEPAPSRETAAAALAPRRWTWTARWTT